MRMPDDFGIWTVNRGTSVLQIDFQPMRVLQMRIRATFNLYFMMIVTLCIKISFEDTNELTHVIE